jgi:hypothetical protein
MLIMHKNIAVSHALEANLLWQHRSLALHLHCQLLDILTNNNDKSLRQNIVTAVVLVAMFGCTKHCQCNFCQNMRCCRCERQIYSIYFRLDI